MDRAADRPLQPVVQLRRSLDELTHHSFDFCAGGVPQKTDAEHRPRDDQPQSRGNVRKCDDEFLPWFAARGACLTCSNRQHLRCSPPRIHYFGHRHSPRQPSRHHHYHPDGLESDTVRERQHRSRQDNEQHAVGYELDVSPKGESWVWSSRDGKAPQQSDQHQNHALNQDLPTATVNAH